MLVNDVFTIQPMDERPIDRALKWARERGWNQSQLAAQLEVAPQHVTNWKTRGMPPEWHEPVARLFGRSIDELMGRPVAPSPSVARPAETPAEHWRATAVELARWAGHGRYVPAQFLLAVDFMAANSPPVEQQQRSEYVRRLLEMVNTPAGS